MNKMRVPDVINLERKWRLGEQLGAGGFASVHLARSENGEPAVVKLIPKAPGAQRELLFEDLDGVPNVVPVLDRGDWNDYWALVMPLAEKSLRGYLNELGRQLPVDDAVSVLVDIAGALVAIEGRVVHRDIKPDNILLLDGRWCLADFGIARYTEATTAPDTRKTAKSQPYAAPEQWMAVGVWQTSVLLATRRPLRLRIRARLRRANLMLLLSSGKKKEPLAPPMCTPLV